jgi:tetratricopeptide (TPR) repeat protein
LLAVLTILSTWFGINARKEQMRAEQNLDKAVEVTNGVVDRVVQMSDKYGVPKPVIGDLLDWTHQAFDFLSKHELSDNLRAAQANNLIVFSDYYGKINDSDKQLQVSQQARKILAALVDVSPSNDVWVKRLSMSYDRIGQAYFARGQLTDALTAHKEQLKLDQQLLAKQPEDPERRRDVATSQERIGTVLQFQGNLTDALAAQDAALSISERLAKENRHDPRLQADLAVSHEKKGELLALLDKTEEALASQQNALVIRFQLAQLLPDNTLRQRELAVSYNKVGQLLVKQSWSFGQQDKPLDQQRQLLDAVQAYQSA